MDKRKYVSVSDRHLIAEQPGMALLLTGLAIAIFIGFTVKSVLSPARVTAQIEKAASHIHKDVKVQFEKAEFSLSDGILPQMAVLITNIKMESEQICWGSPYLEIDQLRLPVSIVSALRGQGALRDIQANIVKLTLRQDFRTCPQFSEDDENVAGSKPEKKTPLVTLSPPEEQQRYQNDIRSIKIGKFSVAARQYPQYNPELLNFNVKVLSYNPRVIELTAKSHLMKDEDFGDYMSHANLYMRYKESPERSLQTHFFGNWREGHYSVIANYTMDENLLAVETDLKHIPLSQILRLLQKYNLASKELNGRQVWISSKARVVAPVDELRSSPMEVRDLRLEGDLGDMRVDTIKVKSIEPLTYEPIAVDIQKLDVEKLLVLLNRPKKTSMLASLGEFTGRAELVSDKNMRLTGEHRGLEFVFSNKGQRELQGIRAMTGDIALKDNTWSFDVRRVEPVGGVFLGRVNLKADRDFKEVMMKADVREISFGNNVQRLMTNGGQVGPMSLEADIKLTDGELRYLKGLALLDSMNLEGMSFGKTRSTFDWKDKELQLRTQVASLEVSESSPAASVLKTVSYPNWWSDKNIKLSAVDGEFRIKSLQNSEWRKFQAQVGKNGRLTSDGGWNTSGELHGHVLAKEARESQRWQISGTRETPLFGQDSSSPNPQRK